MEATQLIEQIQSQYKEKLILTGLAALQHPTVLTRQLTFFNPTGGKKDRYLGLFHVFIRRAPSKKIVAKDHLLFIARHIEFYSKEIDLLVPVLQDVSLKDFEKNDRAWRLFSYLKNRLLQESISSKKTIGRRYIDLGNIQSDSIVTDHVLHIRDALLVPGYLGKRVWEPNISAWPDRTRVEKTLKESQNYFAAKRTLPLFTASLAMRAVWNRPLRRRLKDTMPALMRNPSEPI